MTPREEKDRGKETIPPKMAETTPTVYPGSDYSFTLQCVFEMQKTLGGLTQAVHTLDENTKEHSKELKHIGKVIYAAGVLIPILSVIGMWVLGKLWDFVIAPSLNLHKP